MDEEQLSEKELKALREIIKKDERWKWLFIGSRNVLAWIAVALTGIYMGYEALVKTIKHLGE